MMVRRKDDRAAFRKYGIHIKLGIKMIERLFANTVYIKIFLNRIELKHVESGKVVVEVPQKPFATQRLLVGNFTSASETLNRGMKKLYQGRFFAPKPIVVIQPMEKTEQGLSEVEDRVLRELAADSGARKVTVWLGRELTDPEVIAGVRRV